MRRRVATGQGLALDIESCSVLVKGPTTSPTMDQSRSRPLIRASKTMPIAGTSVDRGSGSVPAVPSTSHGRRFRKSAHCCISRRRRSNASVGAYAASTLLPRLCASAASPTAQGVAVCSMVQSLNVLRKPWGTASISNHLRRLVNAISERGFPERLEGNTEPTPPLNARTSVRTSTARSGN